jgi:hypothetical protein
MIGMGVVLEEPVSTRGLTVRESERRKEIMLPLEDFRTKLLAQRRELFRQAVQTEEDLLWLETDPRGHASHIVRNQLMRTEYGIPLRKDLLAR